MSLTTNINQTEIIKDDGFISDNFKVFLEALTTKLNSVTPQITEISTTGDVTITATNLYFFDSQWPLNTPEDGYVLYRNTAGTMSWVDPSSVTLAPETGKVEVFLGDTAPTGWILFNSGTIGSAASGATLRANDDTEDLFTYLWDNFSDSDAPVSSGRGADAATDFAANKTITLDGIAARILALKDSTYSHFTKTGDTAYFLTANMLPAHEHVGYQTNSSDFSANVPGKLAVNFNDVSNMSSTSYNASTWTDEFPLTNTKYDGANPQEEFDVSQPSINMNLIIKL